MMEPVIAASDYNLFVHMMIRKNIDLQLQALQIIEVPYSSICFKLNLNLGNFYFQTMCGLHTTSETSHVDNLKENDPEKLILLQVIK